jgi:hypothetical protein
MHESDAMDFIYLVLNGFIERNFSSNGISRDDLYLEKIRDFIKNDPPYWVKEKACDIIYAIENLENDIQNRNYRPTSVKRAVNTIIKKANAIIERDVTYKLIGSNGHVIPVYVPPPNFTSRSPLHKKIEEAHDSFIPTKMIF